MAGSSGLLIKMTVRFSGWNTTGAETSLPWKILQGGEWNTII